jgi:hypothetical protein
MKLEPFLIPVLLIVAAITIVACSKSSGSKPKISIETLTNPIDSFGGLDVKFKFTDNSGKLGGGTFTSIRIRLNQKPANNPSGSDTLTGPIPAFSGYKTGEFDYNIPFSGYLHQDNTQNDTLIFKFVAVNSDGISSDTLSSPTIVSLFHH